LEGGDEGDDRERGVQDHSDDCNCVKCHSRRAQTWLKERRSEIGADNDSYRLTLRSYQLLETLIHTVHDEYRSGSRSHWGAEDRRTKLWFIMMSGETIKVFLAALVSGLGRLMLKFAIFPK
jgi:hypothetical protein